MTISKNRISTPRQISLVILCIILWVILSPIVILLSLGILFLYLIRKSVDFIVLNSHPDWKLVKGPDSTIWTPMDTYTDTLYNNCTVFTLNSNVLTDTADIQKLVENIREKFKNKILQPSSWPNDPFWKLRFTPVNKMLYYYWAPVNVDDLSEYIHVHTQEIGTKKMSEDELNKYVIDSWLDSSYHGRSPWEIMIVDTESGPVLCFRMNHVIGGGLSFRWIIEAINGELNEKTGIPILFQPYPYTKIAMGRDLLMLPWNLGYTIRQIFRPDHLHIDIKTLSNVQVFANDRIQLSSVKKISKHFDCPVRNVLSATLGSVLTRFELESSNQSHILKAETKIWAIHPWFYSSVPCRKELNNEIAAGYHTHKFDCSNPVERLRQTNDGIQRSLESGIDRFIYTVYCIGILFPGFVLKRIIAHPPPYINVSTDVPFTSQPQLYILGHPVKSAHFISPIKQTGIGCMAAFLTIGDNIGISIFADESRIPTLEAAQRVCQYFIDEIEQLENIVDSEFGNSRLNT